MNTLLITKNNYGTLFIHLNGKMIADSAVFYGSRGFGNKITKQHRAAKDFTPNKVKKNPAKVFNYLCDTGLFDYHYANTDIVIAY